MATKQVLRRSASFDLSALAIKYDDDCWLLHYEVAEESFEFVSFDFFTISTGWRVAVKSYLARTLLGLTSRPSKVALTVRERFYTLRRFANWCVENGADRPIDVDGRLIREWGEVLTDVGGAKRLSPKAMAMKASNVQELLREQVGCSEEVRAACSELTHRVRRRLALKRKCDSSVSLDEELILSYLSDALLVVSEDAGKIIARSRKLTEQFPVPGRKAKQGISWHTQVSDGHQTYSSKALGRLGQTLVHSEENMIALVTGAALLVVALLSVMRTSELRRLKVGCVERDAGGHSAPWVIKGRLSKSGRPHGWVVVPEVKAAIRVLEEIGVNARRRTGTNCLLAASLLSRRPYISGRTSSWKTGVATSTAMVHRIREFAIACRPDRAAEARLLSFRSTRRFLARFVARRDRSSLGLLALQYGHLDTQITDTYYVGNDPELARLLEKEAELEVAHAMNDLVSARSVYTKLPSEILEESKARMRGVLERASSEVGVLRMLGRGVVLGPCDWGYCFYRENRAICEGDTAGPNPAKRTPTSCVGCLNFTATPRHRSWWSRRIEDLENFCMLRNLPEQSRLLAEDRLKKAREVLAAIDVSP